MTKLGTFAEVLLFLVLALALTLFGAGIPIHFRAVAPGVVVEAGRDGETLDDLASFYLDTGKTGPVELFLALPNTPVSTELLADRTGALIERYPHYAISGGTAPYFQQFLEMLDLEGQSVGEVDVISLLLRARWREHLLDFLGNSSNAAVHAVLETRLSTAFTTFMPVGTPAGQPLDAAILTTALLLQGDDFSLPASRRIKLLAERAKDDDRLAVEQLESFYLSILGLAKRFNWVQLAVLTGNFSDLDELQLAAVLTRENSDKLPLIFSAIVLAEEPGAVFDYLARFQEEGWADLSFALGAGQGALELLLQNDKPLYNPPAFVRVLDRYTAWVRQPPLLSFSHRHPQAAIVLKILVMLAAGYTWALFLSGILQLVLKRPALSRMHPLFIARNGIVALFLATTLWVLIEPTLFASGPEPKGQLRLIFNIASELDSLKSHNLETAMLDQITILIILLFFLMQLIVYLFCLIRISEIRKQDATDDLKLKLLENEDNLFDLGLYVGLGGTVASLILLAMDVVQASLIAAYSSTLFGIIFVAVLKVAHVRPYRRSIIVVLDSRKDEPVPTVDHR